MTKKYLAAASAAILLTAAATAGFAQEEAEREGKRHTWGAGHGMHRDGLADPARLVEMMTRHLDLDDTQSQAIGNILAAAKPEIDALRDRAKGSRDAMRSLDVDDPDYGSSLQNQSVEIGALASEAALLHGRLRADVYAVLTPEQREQAAAGHSGMRGHSRRHRRGEKE